VRRLAAARARAYSAAAEHRIVDLRDTLIGGIAQTRRATIATGNTPHFDGVDVPVVNPWQA
jgi:predicted nucleic acid-binding protein